MKNILVFVLAIAMSVAHVHAGVRDGNTAQRTTQKRIATTSVTERSATNRTNVLTTKRGGSDTASNTRLSINTTNRSATSRQGTSPVISARTTTNQTTTSETRTGAAYEKCKSAFFTCMDQFCALKNDDYRRCSCSKRITDMEKQRNALTDAGEQLTVFTENLDVVGLTAAQATAMRTASEGENALSKDTSASKALLQAIMNSISGGDTTVGGKYSDLNTINISYDLTTVFSTDANQIIASYNGQGLYSAVYPQCRHAVAADCNDASLQRAVNAYLMAIEQDCNTVQTAINERQSQLKSAIRESSAMLDLARVENRRNHNSDDITTCINNVESAILSEEVCGANYHKCLDNGEFIDISTGAPIAGVVDFYKLGELLTFSPGVDAANQKLSKIINNRTFVANFTNRTKKFAEPALDKCTEIADEVWSEYLDKAMLAIYYAQKSKVDQIKQGCFDLISSCYAETDTSITAAMAELIGSGQTILQPDKIALNAQMCTDYVESCNGMFDDKIIENYVENRQSTDTLTACRAIVKQCFDKYGGAGYENFYYPYSGLFVSGTTTNSDNPRLAGDWFTLYDHTDRSTDKYMSPCAKQLEKVDACNDEKIIERAFGGFDKMYTAKDQNEVDQLAFNKVSNGEISDIRYGTIMPNDEDKMRNRVLRPVGVATEIYNQIIDSLTTRCTNINGRFVERQFIKENLYGGSKKNNICLWYPQNGITNYEDYKKLAEMYGILKLSNTGNIPSNFRGEDMCPRDYNLNVDTSFWGACLCWENGGRRSKNGKNATCVAELPVVPKEESTGDDETSSTENTTETNEPEKAKDAGCYTIADNNAEWPYDLSNASDVTFYDWCTQAVNPAGQVCPYGYTLADISKETGYDDNDPYVCKNSADGKLFGIDKQDGHIAEGPDTKAQYKLLPTALQ